MKRVVRTVAAATAILATHVAVASDFPYRVVDLGVGVWQVIPRQVPAVAGNGWIAGADTFPSTRGYVWKDGEVSLIDPPIAGSWSIAYDINRSGTVVGATPGPVPGGTPGRPFVRTQGGELTYIPDLSGAPSVNIRAAYGINDAGTVVGEWEGQAFVYSNGQVSALPTPLDARGSPGGGGAYDINNAGSAVGYASFVRQSSAILWRDGQAIDIGTLPLDPGWTPAASAHAINDSDVIVGQSITSITPNGPRAVHAFRWEEGAFTDLGALRGPEWRSAAYGVNNAGQVVGQSECYSPAACAFLWTAEDGMQDLNQLIGSNSGWHLSNATGINDDGWIVGQGAFGGEARDFLLLPTAPVPEPSTYLLMAMGVFAVAVRQRLIVRRVTHTPLRQR